MSNKLIVILGPTASGKTDLAIKLAKKFNGQIISADSRQIYKEMDIGTNKPKNYPHYLIDIVRPNQDFNVSLYKKKAIKQIKQVQKEHLPFLVGGTGLYISSIANNIDFPKVPPNKQLRRRLEKQTTEQLLRTYQKLDPQGSKLIEKGNRRRLIRAIEVCKTTKQPFWKQRKTNRPLFDILKIGIKTSKQKLEQGIIKRTEKMFKQGLEKEVKTLTKKYDKDLPSMRTIGYQEWLPYMDDPAKNQEKIKQDIITHTLQFAKRQMTWFKTDKTINWITDYKQAEKLIKDFLKT